MTDKKKYDTDPLDPDFPQRLAAAELGGRQETATDDISASDATHSLTGTRATLETELSEAPTRHFAEPPNAASASYPSVFAPASPHQHQQQTQQSGTAHATAYYQPHNSISNTQMPPSMPYGSGTQNGAPPPFVPPVGAKQPPTSRTVAGIKLPENIMLALPYFPFYIGAVAAVGELFLVPRHEARVRFHAAQALALHAVILSIGFAFQLVGMLAGTKLGGGLFSLAAVVFLIVSIVRVLKGERHHIEPLDDAREWIDKQIAPRG